MLRLLAADKCKQAVELAKELHKRNKTSESQRLLVQAYSARIEQFQKKGMPQEAQTLLTLVQQRFPGERHQLGAIEIRAAATGGRIGDLLGPLRSDQTSPEIRNLIESAIAQQITDLSAVAACDVLPAEHPLRVGAASILRAFAAVTSGPVTDADISLPEISRRSPLAAWKNLIRAIAAFYRHDDAGCRRMLEAIPGDSAIAHVAAVLRDMIAGKKPKAGIAAVLYNKVMGDEQLLRSSLERIQSTADWYDLRGLLAGIRDAVRNCSTSRPGLLERLKQHISVWCMVEDVPVEEVRHVLGLTTKNAYFWRLMARATERGGPPSEAALFWERFLRHAVRENLFAESSMEAGAVWLHIADLISPASLRELKFDRKFMGQEYGIGSYYDDQPPEIAALRPESDRRLAETVLDAGQAFSRAMKIQPKAESFRQWLDWAGRNELADKHKEDIALQWHRGLPRDVEPLVLLSLLAESRNALSLAIKRLGEAEAVDPLNPQVRKARIRLSLSIAWRHFADGKAHLVEKDLEELTALPGMGEGDRAAVVESMRGAWHLLRGDVAAEEASLQAVIQQMGPVAGPIQFRSIKIMARQSVGAILECVKAEPQALDLAQAQARLIGIAEDLKLKLYMPAAWDPIVRRVLRQRPCPLSNTELQLLGRAAILQSDMESAYQASSAGLARADAPATTASFLLLRAKSLDMRMHQPRTTQCLRAALELARQAHDEGLIREVFAAIDQDYFTRRIIASARNGQGMADDVLRLVVENEQKAGNFPLTPRDVNEFVARDAVPDLGGRFGEYDDEYESWEEEDDDDVGDEDEEDEEDAPLFNLLPPSPVDGHGPRDMLEPHELQKMMDLADESGVSPESIMENPRSFIEAMAKAIGLKISPAELSAMADELSQIGGNPDREPFGSSFGRKSRGRKKRRR